MNAIVIPFPSDRAAARTAPVTAAPFDTTAPVSTAPFDTAAPVSTAPVGDWSARAHRVLDHVEDLLAGGDAAQVVQLCQQAVDALERSAPDIADDEPLVALADRLGDLHLRACRAAGPDPVDLARWLFRAELHGELGAVTDAAERYADVLGAPGLAEYRRLGRAQPHRRRHVMAVRSRARHPSAVS